jgi:hypothetical protein
MIWRHTRRASRLFFFAFLIFAFRPLPIGRLQGLPLGESLRNLRRAGRFSVSLRGQTRTMRVASWPSPFGKCDAYRARAPHSHLIYTTMGGGHTHTHSHSDYPEQNFTPGAKWIKNLTRDRTGNFSGGHFADVNLSSVLFTHRLDDSKHVQLQRWSAPGITKPSFQEALKQDFQPAKKGESIGPSCE